MSALLPPPEPPVALPPARTVHVKGRGEFFIRDTGGSGPALMLLHGWMVNADLNWCGAYGALAAAGYRVLAIDHRGHGRGLRPLVPFRLTDCAADAAGVLRTLNTTPAVAVGYSMGGAIAQLIARDHADVLTGMVLSATAQHWQGSRERRFWQAMGAVGLALAVSPRKVWGAGFRRAGLADRATLAWVESELLRHSARDLAEAGRELGRFDSRPWLGAVKLPAAIVLTSSDDVVPPFKQRQLAEALGAPAFEAPIGHLDISTSWQTYNPILLAAIESVGADAPAATAGEHRRDL
ncbi:MAG: alpha/beta fold hydrolase [Solirubrobacteraceae bacterium]